MALAHPISEGPGAAGHISNKTMQIALNFQEETNTITGRRSFSAYAEMLGFCRIKNRRSSLKNCGGQNISIFEAQGWKVSIHL